MAQPTWTREQKLEALMKLPWTVTTEREQDTWIGRVAEMSDAIATAGTERELAIDLWESLHASLSVRIDNDDPISLPPKTELPWANSAAPPQKPPRIHVAPRYVDAFRRIEPEFRADAVGDFGTLQGV